MTDHPSNRVRLQALRLGCVLFLLLNLFLCRDGLAQATQPPQGAKLGVRQEILFDQGWRFHRGGAQGAEETCFEDGNWRIVDLPHDWSIEDLPGTESPFSRDAISQVSGGFTVGGTGWYRKSFVLPAEQPGRRVLVQFDGAYMNAETWFNGRRIGSHPYGYTPFMFDLTDSIAFGKTNFLAVKISNEGENSRWYSGSGLYRHVWLKILNPVHVAQDGVYVTTPQVSTASAGLKVRTRVANQEQDSAQVKLLTRIMSESGTEVARMESSRAIGAQASFEFEQTSAIEAPVLWSLDHPVLYSNLTEVYRNEELQDQVVTRFGIRKISFDVTNGFCLNGQLVKLKGGCLHHDNGPLGACAYDRAEERKVELLKASGFNAVRCAHNPPSPAFLDACDRLGMLVLDEAFDMWATGKNPADYHLYFPEWWRKDLESMVARDRNHPAIILWSIGNEIPGKEKPAVAATARQLGDAIRQLDPSRPVTSAVNDIKPDKDAYFATLDVCGYNYAVGGDHGQSSLYHQEHQRAPGRIMVCTESYPLLEFGSWMEAQDHPYVIGDFVWTAWDYIGEAGIGWRGYSQCQDFFPWNLAFCGDIDICGWKRPQSFYRDALWTKDQLSIFVKPPQPSFDLNPRRLSWSKWHFDDVVADWNWQGKEGQPFEVSVYSSCDAVELFLNSKSLGRKPANRATKFIAIWSVPYKSGSLQAVGYDGGHEVSRSELCSAAAPSQLRLQADRATLRASGEDLSYITVELLDAQGVRNPKADNLVRFEIEGPGSIVGVGNANPVSLESCRQPQRRAWHGRCLVIVKAATQPGVITVNAKADGLAPGQMVLAVEPLTGTLPAAGSQ